MAENGPKDRRGYLASRVLLATELEFKAAAKAEGTTPSSLIRQFVESYLIGYQMRREDMEVEERESVPA